MIFGIELILINKLVKPIFQLMTVVLASFIVGVTLTLPQLCRCPSTVASIFSLGLYFANYCRYLISGVCVQPIKESIFPSLQYK